VINHDGPVEPRDVEPSDVVVATWWETAEWLATFPPDRGAKTYFVQHYEAHDYQPKDRVNATLREPFHKIAVSHWLVELCENEFGDHDVSLAANGVDCQQFCGPPRRKQTTPTVGLMYANPKWKGTDIALAAIEKARFNHTRLQVVTFGKSALSNRFVLPPNVRTFLRPSQNELAAIYAKCDAWLFPSRREGFGLPILEAMACRTPVIATPAGAAPEILEHGGGYLVNPEDPDDMARAIDKICEMSDDEWQKFSKQARATAEGYTWEDACTQFEASLYKAIERARRGEVDGLPQSNVARRNDSMSRKAPA